MWIYQELSAGTHEESPFLSHLNALKTQWTSEVIQVPDDWILENPVERRYTPAYKSERLAPSINTLLRIWDMIAPLTLEAQQSQSLDFSGPEPDFFEPVPGDEEGPEDDIPGRESASVDNVANFLRLEMLLNFRQCDPDRVLIGVTNKLAEVLQELPGFFLRKSVSNGFAGADDHLEPVEFGLLVRQHGSRPEKEWGFDSPYAPPIWPQRRAVSLAMRISDTHPAVIMGIIDPPDSYPSYPSDSFPSSGSSKEPALHRLARQIQPSLEAVLKTWQMRQQQHGGSIDPPSWLILFGLIVTANVVKVVAHYPRIHDVVTNEDQEAPNRNGASDARFYSCLIDEIPHHSGACWHRYIVQDGHRLKRVANWLGPVEDDTWIRDRLRLFMALKTIVKNSMRISAIWDDIDWPQEVLEAEDALEKLHAQWDIPTPGPSAYAEDSTSIDRMIWEERYGDLIEESDDDVLDKGEEMKNRNKVLAWQKKLPLDMLIPG